MNLKKKVKYYFNARSRVSIIIFYVIFIWSILYLSKRIFLDYFQIDFNAIQVENIAERQRLEDAEKKRQKLMADRLDKVQKDISGECQENIIKSILVSLLY